MHVVWHGNFHPAGNAPSRWMEMWNSKKKINSENSLKIASEICIIIFHGLLSCWIQIWDPNFCFPKIQDGPFFKFRILHFRFAISKNKFKKKMKLRFWVQYRKYCIYILYFFLRTRINNKNYKVDHFENTVPGKLCNRCFNRK